MTSWFQFGAFVANFFVSAIIGILGAKKSFLFAILLFSAGNFLLLFSKNYLTLMISAFALGFNDQFVTMSIAVIMISVFGEINSMKYMAWAYTGYAFCSILWPQVMNYLINPKNLPPDVAFVEEGEIVLYFGSQVTKGVDDFIIFQLIFVCLICLPQILMLDDPEGLKGQFSDWIFSIITCKHQIVAKLLKEAQNRITAKIKSSIVNSASKVVKNIDLELKDHMLLPNKDGKGKFLEGVNFYELQEQLIGKETPKAKQSENEKNKEKIDQQAKNLKDRSKKVKTDPKKEAKQNRTDEKFRIDSLQDLNDNLAKSETKFPSFNDIDDIASMDYFEETDDEKFKKSKKCDRHSENSRSDLLFEAAKAVERSKKSMNGLLESSPTKENQKMVKDENQPLKQTEDEDELSPQEFVKQTLLSKDFLIIFFISMLRMISNRYFMAGFKFMGLNYFPSDFTLNIIGSFGFLGYLLHGIFFGSILKSLDIKKCYLLIFAINFVANSFFFLFPSNVFSFLIFSLVSRFSQGFNFMLNLCTIFTKYGIEKGLVIYKYFDVSSLLSGVLAVKIISFFGREYNSILELLVFVNVAGIVMTKWLNVGKSEKEKKSLFVN